MTGRVGVAQARGANKRRVGRSPAPSGNGALSGKEGVVREGGDESKGQRGVGVGVEEEGGGASCEGARNRVVRTSGYGITLIPQ